MHTLTPSSSAEVLRREVRLRTPFRIEALPLLSRLHSAAFLPRRRISKRFIGKPAKQLFRLLIALGVGGRGRFSVSLPEGRREVEFNARNTQFGALYQPQSQPIYEAETSALLDLLVADVGCFVDVGSNWGWYSLLVASRPGFNGQVHAFEPFPSSFADLEAVVRSAGLGNRITCHDVALADTIGTATMALSDGIQSGLARLGEAGGVTIRMTTMDSLTLPPPDVIKIDAEDHELEVLRGAEVTIEQARPYVVFENWLHRDRPALTLDPFHWFAERGYCFFHAGWVAGEPSFVVQELSQTLDGRATLALMPLLAAQRFHLPCQLNVLAVPSDRLDDLRNRVEGVAMPSKPFGTSAVGSHRPG